MASRPIIKPAFNSGYTEWEGNKSPSLHLTVKYTQAGAQQMYDIIWKVYKLNATRNQPNWEIQTAAIITY